MKSITGMAGGLVNSQSVCDVSNGWLPIELGGNYEIVRWMKVGSFDFQEPFFETSVRVLRQQQAPPEFETDVQTFVDIVGGLQSVQPRGVIVHMSRCGSTHVLNQMRAAESVVCLSEAQPLDRVSLLAMSRSSWWSALGRKTMGSLAGAFSSCQGGGVTRDIVVKYGISGALSLPAIRAQWPSAPIVILIREPIEVVVSNLTSPSRWLTDWFGDPTLCWYGMPPEEALGEPREFCAWLVGRICESLHDAKEAADIILDYEDLTPTGVRAIAELFGLQFSPAGEDAFSAGFEKDAKDKQKVFIKDAAQKQKAASASLRSSVERWVGAPYRALKQDVRFGRCSTASCEGASYTSYRRQRDAIWPGA